MTYQHPTQKQVSDGQPVMYEGRENYVQALIASYEKAKKEMFNWAKEEAALVAAMNALVDEVHIGLDVGKTVLEGVQQKVTVERHLSASYPRERGEEHPLRLLLGKFDELGALLNVDYKESGKKIQALLARAKDDKLKLGDNAELAAELVKIRQTKAAKPKFIVEDKVSGPTDPSVADAPGDAGSPLY